MQRKILVHPAFAPFVREVAKVREEMQAALRAIDASWDAEVASLREELNSAHRELDRLRALSVVRDMSDTVH